MRPAYVKVHTCDLRNEWRSVDVFAFALDVDVVFARCHRQVRDAGAVAHLLFLRDFGFVWAADANSYVF